MQIFFFSLWYSLLSKFIHMVGHILPKGSLWHWRDLWLKVILVVATEVVDDDLVKPLILNAPPFSPKMSRFTSLSIDSGSCGGQGK